MTPSTVALPAVDTVAAAREAEATVKSARNGVTDDPEAVGGAMRRLIEAATFELDAVRPRRDELALSIREYGPDATEAVPVAQVLKGIHLAEAVGVSKARLAHLRDLHSRKYGDAPVPLIQGARAELPGVAYRAQVLGHILIMAREVRDDVALDLANRGWRIAEIAKVTGCDPTRVSQLRRRAGVSDVRRRAGDARLAS